MLLSASDKSRFIILYRELSNKELAKVFNTNERVVIQIAKDLGVYESKRHNSDLWKRASANKI